MSNSQYAIASFDTGMPGIHLHSKYATQQAATDQLRIVVQNSLVRVCGMQRCTAEAATKHALKHPYERGVCEFDLDRGIAKVHYRVQGKPEMIWFQVVAI